MAVREYYVSTQGNQQITPHFRVEEFQCHDGTDRVLIDDDLCNTLERLFELFSLSRIDIYSGYRTPDYSVSVGGKYSDQHTKGKAADVICYDKNGLVVSPKVVCIGLEALKYQGGVGYISDNANTTHVDVRGYKCWFDESRNEEIVNSWADRFNLPLIGDVDGDGIVSTSDSRLVLRAATNMETLDWLQIFAADLDMDNQITSADARTIMRLATGLI